MSATALPDDKQRRELRQAMREQRLVLTPMQRMAAAQGLRRQLEAWPDFRAARRIAGYWASRGEMPLNLAVAPLAKRGQQFYLPRTGKHRSMQFARWHDGDEVAPNQYGIPEPLPDARTLAAEELDLVLVPLLAFDTTGMRLGSGGGYYDTCFGFLLAKPRPARPLLVGVGYAFQQVGQLQARTWDVSLDYVATDTGLINCHSGSDNP